MKKKILAVTLGIAVNLGICAQGYPVMDITNILASIENGYTMVEQLRAMYNNIKTTYEQLQQQIKSFESFDFKTLDAKDPLGSWKSLNTYASRMMAYEENIEAIINRKDIKIGNSSYSLGDIFTAPGQSMQNMAMDGLNLVVFDPFERKLSPEEKAVFHQKYGMSYGHHMRFKQLGEMLQKKAGEVVGYSNGLQKNLTEDRERLEHIAEGMFDSESTIQQQQINNAVITIMAQDIKTQANLLGDIAQQLAVNSAHTLLEKQAMQDEINMNELDLPGGLIKMLDEMQSSSAYR